MTKSLMSKLHLKQILYSIHMAEEGSLEDHLPCSRKSLRIWKHWRSSMMTRIWSWSCCVGCLLLTRHFGTRFCTVVIHLLLKTFTMLYSQRRIRSIWLELHLRMRMICYLMVINEWVDWGRTLAICIASTVGGKDTSRKIVISYRLKVI